MDAPVVARRFIDGNERSGKDFLVSWGPTGGSLIVNYPAMNCRATFNRPLGASADLNE
jgi:hypothetical protein